MPIRTRTATLTEKTPTPTRTQSACNSLRRIADELGANARMPSFLELRENLKVSVVTLNKALERLEGQQVLYRRHGVGIFVSQEVSRKTVALMCNPIFFTAAEVSPFWHILVEQVRASVSREGHRLLFQFTTDPSNGDHNGIALQMEVMEAVKAGRIHGVLGIGISEGISIWLKAHGVPVIAFAGYSNYQDHEHYAVSFDNSQLVTVGVPLLVEKGCQRIGIWTAFGYHLGAEDTGEKDALVARFEAVLAESRLPFHPELVWEARHLPILPDGRRVETFWEQGYRTANAVLDGPQEQHPDAIICNSELMVQGALIAMEKRGMRLREDMEVVGHANIGSRILSPWEDDIVRVANDPAEMARVMLLQLEARMRGESPEPRHRMLIPKIFP
ncbi:MAG: substrate-binding domain-containing protein [Fibrella sp.]|nr:substrate-binding domain-containing protein [Armatimonadota bacterium]